MEMMIIGKARLDGQRVDAVNSREIYELLEIQTQYSVWIQRAIEKYDFQENVDFSISKFEYTDRPPQLNYIVTLDMAKELCMVSNTKKGKETRRYFLDIENKMLYKVNNQIEDKSIQTQMIKFDAEISVAEKIILSSNIEKLKLTMEAYKIVGSTFSPNEYAKTIGRPLNKGEKDFIRRLPEANFATVDGINKLHTTISLIIQDYSLNTYAQMANEILILAGILNEDRSFTKKGEYFGFDWINVATTGTTQPRWYNDRTAELVEILKRNGVTQGDI